MNARRIIYLLTIVFALTSCSHSTPSVDIEPTTDENGNHHLFIDINGYDLYHTDANNTNFIFSTSPGSKGNYALTYKQPKGFPSTFKMNEDDSFICGIVYSVKKNNFIVLSQKGSTIRDILDLDINNLIWEDIGKICGTTSNEGELLFTKILINSTSNTKDITGSINVPITYLGGKAVSNNSAGVDFMFDISVATPTTDPVISAFVVQFTDRNTDKMVNSCDNIIDINDIKDFCYDSYAMSTFDSFSGSDKTKTYKELTSRFDYRSTGNNNPVVIPKSKLTLYANKAAFDADVARIKNGIPK